MYLHKLAISSYFQSTARETNAPQTYKPKRGQRPKHSTRAKAKGQSRMVPPGGFLRGEQFERERVVPPLSRLLCLLSCRSKKVRPPAGSTSRFDDSTQLKKFMVSIPTSKYHPQSKPERHRPLAPSVTATPCQLPPGGSYGAVPCHIGLLRMRSACCGIPQSPSAPAPFGKGAFGCGIDTGRVREVTNRRKLPCEFAPGGTPAGGSGK